MKAKLFKYLKVIPIFLGVIVVLLSILVAKQFNLIKFKVQKEAVVLSTTKDSLLPDKNEASRASEVDSSPSIRIIGEEMSTPKPTPAPKAYIPPQTVSNSTSDPDPVISCNVHPDCGGGTRLLKNSTCNKSICCQIGSSWIFYEDRDKCTQDQNANNSSRTTVTNNYIIPPPPSNDISPLSNYTFLYVSAYGISYYCRNDGLTAIQAADADYQRAINDSVSCLFSGTDDYSQCLQQECKDLATFDACAKLCDEATKPDCTKATDSTQYQRLESLMIQFCR